MTDAERLHQIQNRLEAITPGRWQNCGGYSIMVVLDRLRAAEVARTIPPGEDNFEAAQRGEWETNWKEDCDFFTHAPADVAFLTEHIATLEAENATLRQEIEDRRLNDNSRVATIRFYEAQAADLLKVIEAKDAENVALKDKAEHFEKWHEIRREELSLAVKENAALRKRVEALEASLRVAATAIHRDTSRNAAWLAGEALHVHAIEEALTTDDAAEGEAGK